MKKALPFLVVINLSLMIGLFIITLAALNHSVLNISGVQILITSLGVLFSMNILLLNSLKYILVDIYISCGIIRREQNLEIEFSINNSSNIPIEIMEIEVPGYYVKKPTFESTINGNCKFTVLASFLPRLNLIPKKTNYIFIQYELVGKKEIKRKKIQFRTP